MLNRSVYLKIVRFVAFVATSLTMTAFGQKLTGKWYGIGKVDFKGNSYLCELDINQNQYSITGNFNYYFRDVFFTNPIQGSFNAASRKLTIDARPIIFHKTTNAELGIDCMMAGSFILKMSQIESTLTGSFYGDEPHKYTCPPINITFIKDLNKSVDSPIEIPQIDSLSPDFPIPIDSITANQSLIQVNRRLKDIVKELEVSEDSVRIDLYDNGEYDRDSVTVFYNNKIVQERKELSPQNPITFYVVVDSISANNDLILFAENLGTIPPNSALMVVSDKDHRYEIPLVSNYQKNAAIRLRKK